MFKVHFDVKMTLEVDGVSRPEGITSIPKEELSVIRDRISKSPDIEKVSLKDLAKDYDELHALDMMSLIVTCIGMIMTAIGLFLLH